MQLKFTHSKRCAVISVIIILSFSTVYTKSKLKYAVPTFDGCEIIGFPNATINECGYCVGGGTELDQDYGKDCEGKCFGDAVIDCQSECGGTAFLDECSGTCISADELSNNEVNGSVNRDCRGLCIPPELSRPQQQAYDRDECGVCRLQSSDKSAFIDCNGNCQMPGMEKVSLICGQCIDKNAQVIDECGNCRNEKHICSCDRDASICGCHDLNNCYNVKSVIPRAVPNDIQSKLLLLGYFHPVVRDLHCLLQNELSGNILSFPVSFIHRNKTALECLIKVNEEGNYVISLGIIKNSINAFTNNLLKLKVYNKTEVFKIFTNSEMYPKNITTNDSNQTINLQFSDPSNTLPAIPFRCKVLYSDNFEELTIEGNELNACALNPSKLRSKSQTLYITPTFDGINSLSKAFKLNITAPNPQLSHQNSYVSEDGLAIIIMFDKPVDINQNMKNSFLCEYLLTNETIDFLNIYKIRECLWASKVQLIITTDKPISDNTVLIKFNKNVLRESDQLLTLSNEIELEVTARRLSAEPSWWSFEPLIAITGPSEIPNCGLFALIGHFSSPRGTSDVQFEWDVMGEVSSELKEHIESNGKSTNLVLSSDFFDIHIPYKFIFRALIPVRDQTLEVGHTLIKLNYDSPIVSIYHTRLLQSTPLYSDQDILLLADISVPECAFPIQKISVFWKVIDPRVLFPLKNSTQRESLLYEVKPNTVPTDQAIDIYLNAFFGLRYNETSGARFTFVATKAPIKANIANGSTKISIGSKSGSFRLSSKSSKSERRLVYQWSCHESKTAQPCYNFDSSHSNEKDSLLINRKLQKESVLQIDSSSMEPNKQYWFGLQVFDSTDNKIASETEYTLVKVSEGNAPQVFVEPLYIHGKYLVPYNTRLSTYIVPANTPITIKGLIKPAKDILSIKWEAINSLYHLNWRNTQIDDEIHSELYIHENQIVPFGIYEVKLIACNVDKHCSEADTSFMATQTVTMCELSVEHFTEYAFSIANIQKCNTPPNSAPLTYQLYLADESLENPLPLSVPQFSSVITFVGTPVSASKQITRFAAQVCDRFGSCRLYYSQSVNIERTSNETAAIIELLKTAKRYHTAGDSIAALSVLGNVLMKQNGILFPLCEKVINDSIEYSRHALELPQQILTDGHLSVVYSVLSTGLLKTHNSHIKRQLLALIQSYTQKAVALNKLPKINTIKSLYSNLMKSFIRTKQQSRSNFTFDSEFLYDLRMTFREIRAVAAAQIQLGTVLRFNSESDSDGQTKDNAITEIIHHFKVYDVDIKAKLNQSSTVEAKIHFGDEVKQNFSSFWNCEQEKLCQSVVFSITLFPNENPYPVLEKSHKLSPILDITIHAPNTGKEQIIKGLFKAATFQITITGNATEGGTDLITLCHYYDENERIWKKDDVHSLGIAYNRVGCWSGHLSSFVVLRTVLGISADYVIGVLVACLMGVLVFGIMLVFFVQKKREDSSRVSPKPSESIPKKALENPRYRKPKPSSIEIETQQTILYAN